MPITKEQFILLLNEDLRKEYAAAIQYIQHAAILDSFYTPFSSELLDHAKEEISHATTLSNHINYLSGIPSFTSDSTRSALDNQENLQFDLDGENEAIKRYKERIEQAVELKDYGTQAILLSILKDEEHHANDIETFLAGVK